MGIAACASAKKDGHFLHFLTQGIAARLVRESIGGCLPSCGSGGDVPNPTASSSLWDATGRFPSQHPEEIPTEVLCCGRKTSAVTTFSFSLLSEEAKIRSDILIKLEARHFHVFFTWAGAVFLLNLILTRFFSAVDRCVSECASEAQRFFHLRRAWTEDLPNLIVELSHVRITVRDRQLIQSLQCFQRQPQTLSSNSYP